eukprot:TRINITY_DN377_c1_g1_i1.p1 TRINITY_DN377_c1_g1~~TRINITY_DN377_c1_g1_i1.p1  ORF type:complete len:327 (-),score=61.02 TRINITY_DN377_c1_g1_i1:163-1143(-)
MDTNPGLRDYEVSLLRLIDKITNGTIIQINETGTCVNMKPGLIMGGDRFTHDCPNSRSVGYYIEALLMLAPFAKKPLSITLKGITNDDLDNSVDILRTVSFPLLRRFGLDDDVDLKIVKRGAPPGGGGEVVFSCPTIKELKPINLVNEGKIKRIRGVCYSCHGNPANANRVIDKARAIFNNFIPDVYIYVDHSKKGKESGVSPGCAISLVSQSTTGCLLASQRTALSGADLDEIGTTAAKILCEEIAMGGCVDSMHQSLMCLFMVLCSEDISRVRVGPLTPYTMESLRLYRDLFGVTFKIDTDSKTKTVLLSCQGVGFKNLARKSI